MKIALIHSFLTKIGGAEKVLSAAHDIYPEAPIYTLLLDKNKIDGLFNDPEPKIMVSSLNKYPSILKRSKKYLLSKYSTAIEEFDLSAYDVVISFSNAFTHGILTKPSTLHISYCYSPMRFVWDWYHEYTQENNIGLNAKGLYIRKLLHDIRLWDRLAADRVDRWLVQSQTARARVKKYYRTDSTVIYPPTDIENIVMAQDPPEDFFLIVSRLEPYKNIALAIKAFSQIKRKLIIVGEGSDRKRLEKLASSNVRFLGWQSDESVRDYMKRSYAFVFPGEEDFGLTPIEVMASGRPVVAFNKGGVAETVVDGETGVLFNEPASESLIEAINRLDRSYDKFSSDKCRRRAEMFSFDNFKRSLSSYIKKEYENFRQKRS